MEANVAVVAECPKCECLKFQGGPKGGQLSQNIRCENGHCWNRLLPNDMPKDWEDIGDNVEGTPGCSCPKKEEP